MEAEDVAEHITSFWQRCEMARFVGGLAEEEVFGQGLSTDGYWYDHQTCYWIPVGVSLDIPQAKN